MPEHDTPASFEAMGLSPLLLAAVARMGFAQPTPVQAAAVPPLLAGRDVLALAQTGTGKTAAFLLPTLHRLIEAEPPPERGCGALILAPTRELASQTATAARALSADSPLRVELAYGGVPRERQAGRLRGGVSLLVATPGRLLDLAADGSVRLDGCRTLVLDEADRMLSLGFVEQIAAILDLLPQQMQTAMVSATMDDALSALARRLLHKPVRVEMAAPATVAAGAKQLVVFAEAARKLSLAEAFLRRPDVRRALVFVRTKQGADTLVAQLARAKVQAAAIHGDRSQAQRERTLAGFRKGSVRVLVATDVAARGIDVEDITHVMNFDMPEQPDGYVHRIGRTARAGASGVAISFCSAGERPMLREIEKLTRERISVIEPGTLLNG
ncbi:DEAD/DEAH box helicase [Rhizosaccharibacter radicis]|uniref:DEAD/DEAH box helicase n=1 Tax=Rhizosaccharibacter radicis TaxID=2782605 RepID=A0ABT1VYM1_9PROT|nr:DEAD/DEAH box helicase [Acetobacteraceae bacterium KSS12]